MSILDEQFKLVACYTKEIKKGRIRSNLTQENYYFVNIDIYHCRYQQICVVEKIYIPIMACNHVNICAAFVAKSKHIDIFYEGFLVLINQLHFM